MDPLSAIGLAASIILVRILGFGSSSTRSYRSSLGAAQSPSVTAAIFIDFGLKIAKRLDEFSSKNPGEVPKSLLAISTQLPLLLNALGRITSDAQIKSLDFDTKCILRGMVAGCQAQVVEVERMINEITSAPGDSFKVKIRKVFTSLKYDEKVWEVERNLQTYISVLILHHVIDSVDTVEVPVDDTFFDVREQRVSPFVERPRLMGEIDDYLHDAARSRTQNPVILLLVGEKGVGKTQLALEYCYQAHLLGQFRTVFWLDASTLENLYLGFEGMYATIKRATDGSRPEKLAFVTNFLHDLWHPWLLVLDNYETVQLYNHIIEILPSRGYGGIILIARGKAHDGLGRILHVPKFLTVEEQQAVNSLLAEEVHRKTEGAIQRAVNQGADVNTLIWDEWPILHRCAMLGLADAVAFLLERGATPNPPGAKVRKPLYWAARGHEEIAAMLLDHEDEIGLYTTVADNQAAFNEAAEHGSLEIIRMVRARREVNLSGKTLYETTPLQSAAKNGHTEVVRFLIEEGALQEDHAQGDAALISAVAGGYLPIVKLLCCEGKVSPNARDEQGRSALYHAAQTKDPDAKEGNSLEIAKFLLSKGGDPNPIGDAEGPLHRAAIYDHVEMIRLLLQHGAEERIESNGFCPLTNAIRYKSTGSLALLLQPKAGDGGIRKGCWLERGLRYVCRTGERAVALQLLQAGADINAVAEVGFQKGATPLLLAILKGHVTTAQLLIRRGARQDIADQKGRIALPLAAENGYAILVRDLIRAGGEANLKSGENEDTPLMLAAGKGHEKTVKVLLENGADREATNKFGETALDVAEEKEHLEIVKLLD